MHTGAYAIRPYWVTTNFYLSRILSMQITGYMLGRMQYAPTGLQSTSTDKEYYSCGRQDICRSVCFCAPTGLRPTSTDKKYQLCRWLGTF